MKEQAHGYNTSGLVSASGMVHTCQLSVTIAQTARGGSEKRCVALTDSSWVLHGCLRQEGLPCVQPAMRNCVRVSIEHSVDGAQESAVARQHLCAQRHVKKSCVRFPYLRRG